MKIILSALFVLILQSCIVPIPAEKDCLIEKAKVTQIFEGGVKDVCFRLENTDIVYYINRGLEQELTLESLQAQLMGKEVTIKYPDYFSFLGSGKRTIHLCKLEYKNEVIYNELKS